MNTYDKYVLPPLPLHWDDFMAADTKRSVLDYTREAIEADRQARNCGRCVPLSTDGTAVFIDGVGEVPLDFSGQARGEPSYWKITKKDGVIFFECFQAALENYKKEGCSVEPLYAVPQPQQIPEDFVDELAQEIRRVDGNHSLGAAALAERLVPFLSRTLFEAAPDGQE